jgi:hypothetical protein
MPSAPCEAQVLQDLLRDLLRDFARLKSHPAEDGQAQGLGLDCHAQLPGDEGALSLSCSPALAQALAEGALGGDAAGLEQDAVAELCNLCCSSLAGQDRGFYAFLPRDGAVQAGTLLVSARVETPQGLLAAGIWTRP